MCDRKIAVGLDATAQPSDRIRVGDAAAFAEACERHPLVSVDIARRDTKCLLDMGLGFLGVAESILGDDR